MIRTLIVSLLLLSSPVVAGAQECHSETTPTCADGTIYDAETKACVKIVS